MDDRNTIILEVVHGLAILLRADEELNVEQATCIAINKLPKYIQFNIDTPILEFTDEQHDAISNAVKSAFELPSSQAKRYVEAAFDELKSPIFPEAYWAAVRSLVSVFNFS